MLSSCISKVFLFLASFVARRAGIPLEQFLSFDRSLPLVQLGCRGIKLQVKKLILLRDGWNEILLQAGVPLQLRTVLIEHLVLKLSLCGTITLTVKGVYALVSTTNERRYDAEREAQQQLAQKRKQLATIEEEEEGQDSSRSKGCFQRLTACVINYVLFKIIRRLEVSVEDIHVRLEDQLSAPGEPLAIGCTLKQLSVKESKERRNALKNASVKDVQLSDTAVYLNPLTTDLVGDSSDAEAMVRLQNVPFSEVVGFSYVLKSTSVSTSLQVAGGKQSVIDVRLGAEMDELCLKLSKDQLRSVIEFLGYFQHLQNSRYFLQFKPTVPVAGHAKEWWQYAIKSVVNSIEQRTGTWIWEELRDQRTISRSYEECYEALLLAKKPSKAMKATVKELEDEVSLLNIMIARRKVKKELRIRRLMDDLATYLAKKQKEDVATKEGKTPKQPFVTASVDCQIQGIQLQFVDTENAETEIEMVKLSVEGTKLKLDQQTGELCLAMSVHSVECSGLTEEPNPSSAPVLFSRWSRAIMPSDAEPPAVQQEPVLNIELKAYPKKKEDPNKEFDFEVDLSLQPTIFKFDKATFLKLAEVVSLFRSSNESLKDAVRETLDEIQYRSKKKIKLAIKERKMVGLSADIWLPVLVIPEEGEANRVLTLDCGHLEIQTEGSPLTDAGNLPKQPSVKYDTKLCGVSVSLAYGDPAENWEEKLRSGIPLPAESEVFNCSRIQVKATVTAPPEESELKPSTAISSTIPGVVVKLSNVTLEEGAAFASKQAGTVVELMEAIQTANEQEMSRRKKAGSAKFLDVRRTATAGKVMEGVEKMSERSRISRQCLSSKVAAQSEPHVAPDSGSDYTDGEEPDTSMVDQSLLCFYCKIEEIYVSLGECEGGRVKDYLCLSVGELEAKADQREEDLQLRVGVGAISLKDYSQHSQDGTPLQILSAQQHFFSAAICLADPLSMYFKTKFNSIKTDITGDIAPCVLYICDDSALHLLKFILSLKLKQSVNEILRAPLAITSKASSSPKQVLKRRKKCDGVINMRICLKFGEALLIISRHVPVANFRVTGIEAEMKDTAEETTISACIKAVSVEDCLQEHFTYHKVVSSILNEDIIQSQCVLRKLSIEEELSQDPNSGIKLEANVVIGEITTTLLFKFIKTMQLFSQHLVYEMLAIWNELGSQWRGEQQISSEPPPVPFKYHLVVDVHTVTLILPKCSSTLEQIDVQLHSLSVSNGYSYQEAALLEKTSVQFDGLSVKRCGPDQKIVSSNLLAPNFSVSLVRVVVPASTPDAPPLPQFTVNVDFKEMEANFSNVDLSILPVIILHNLSEEEPLGLSYPAPAPSTSRGEESSSSKPESSTEGEELAHVVVNLEQLKCILSVFESQQLDEAPNSKKSSQKLCEIALVKFSAEIGYKSDSSLKALGSLNDMSIEDVTTPVRSKVLHYSLYHGTAPHPPLFKFTASMDTIKEVKADAKLQHIHLGIWPAFLTNLLKFATTSVPQIEAGDGAKTDSGEKAEGNDNEVFEEPKQSSSISLSASVSLDCLSLALVEGPPSSSPYGLCVELKSHKHAKSAMEVTFSQTPAQQCISVDPLYIEIALCLLSDEGITGLSEVLKPCCLWATYLNSATEETINFRASRLVLFASSETLKTVMKPISELCSSVQMIQSISPEPHGLDENIWEVKNIDRKQILGAAKGTTEEVTANTSKPGRADRTKWKKEQKATISLPEVMINGNIMIAGDSSSVFCFSSAIEAAVCCWSTEIMADMELKAEAYIYNRRIAAWEPFLEPLEDQQNGCYRPWTMVAKVRQVEGDTRVPTRGPASIVVDTETRRTSSARASSSHSMISPGRRETSPSAVVEEVSLGSTSSTEEAQPDGKSIVVIVSSDDRLELTVSPGSIETIQTFVDALNESDDVVRVHLANCMYESRPPLRIYNKCGLNVSVFPGPTFKPGDSNYTTPFIIPGSDPTVKHIASAECTPTSPLSSKKSQGLSGLFQGVPSIFSGKGENMPDSGPARLPRIAADRGEDAEETVCTLVCCAFSELEAAFLPDEDTQASDEGHSDSESEEEEGSKEEMEKDEIDGGESISGKRVASDAGIFRKIKGKIPLLKKKVPAASSISEKVSLNERVIWTPKGLSKNHKFCIQAEGGKKSKPLPISLPGRLPVPLFLPPDKVHAAGKSVMGICDVEVDQGARKIIIRSGLQVENKLPVLVSLYACLNDTTILPLVEVDQGTTYDIPLRLTATDGATLQIGVGSGGYCCENTLDWKKMSRDKKPVILACPESTQHAHGELFYIRAVIKSYSVVHRRSQKCTPSQAIVLESPLSFQNLLPIPITLSFKKSSVDIDSSSVSPGESEAIYRLDPKKEQVLSIEIPSYSNLRWSGEVRVKVGNYGNERIKLEGFDANGQRVTKMYIGIFSNAANPSIFRLHCPYWVVNKTGLSLEYEHEPGRLDKKIHTSDPGSENSTTLIYFKPKVEEKQRKLKVRVTNGQWSKAFALGTTGKAGNITACKDGDKYELGIQNHLSGNILTHIIYILPKYTVLNKTQIPLVCLGHKKEKGEISEVHSVTVQPDEMKPFWPGNHHEAVLAFSGDGAHTKPFSLDEFAKTVLATNMKNELSGLCVKVQPDSTECCVLVTVTSYVEGSAPIRVDNLCRKLVVSFGQSGSGQRYIVQSSQSKLYTWDNPTQQRKLVWQVLGETMWTSLENKRGNKRGLREVVLSGSGSEETAHCWWMVFFDGSQQVLRLFDELEDYLQLCPPAPARMAASLELFCSLEGVGLSIINATPLEVAYCCILSSPAVWLRKRGAGQWWVLAAEKSIVLETAWRTGKETVDLDGETYNLSEMQIHSSKGGLLSRTFNPGLWVWASATENHYALNIKIGRVQVDNQLSDYVLPTRIVLAAERLLDPEEVVAPFFDAMVIMRKPRKLQKVMEFEKASMKLKAMQVNVELGLVAALISLAEPFLEEQLTSQFHHDMELVEKSPSQIFQIRKDSDTQPKTHFDQLQLAPIQISVSYTTDGDYDLSSVLGQLLNSILHFSLLTNGSFSIDMSAIEMTNETLDIQELFGIIMGHYKNAVLGQLHAIVFGLDVIGNPARLLQSFEIGAKDFISKSAEGFDEREIGAGVAGVAGGVKTFLGHVIEGSAESATSTTGSFRNTLLATTDIDYRKKHRHLSHTSSEGLTTNVLLGTRFFAEGLFHGLTDIFTKPIAGAEKEGAKGFIEGVGKGTLSILTKPTLGVLDLAHFTLEGVRSAADSDPTQQTVRFARYVHPTKVMSPYNTHDAEGMHILWSMPVAKKGSAIYYGHQWLPMHKKGEEPRVFLVSSLRLFQLKRDGRLFEVDDWSSRVEYLEKWEAVSSDSGKEPALYIEYGDDSLLDKLGSKLFHFDDHKAEVHKHATFEMVSDVAALYLEEKITEAYQDLEL